MYLSGCVGHIPVAMQHLLWVDDSIRWLETTALTTEISVFCELKALHCIALHCIVLYFNFHFFSHHISVVSYNSTIGPGVFSKRLWWRRFWAISFCNEYSLWTLDLLTIYWKQTFQGYTSRPLHVINVGNKQSISATFQLHNIGKEVVDKEESRFAPKIIWILQLNNSCGLRKFNWRNKTLSTLLPLLSQSWWFGHPCRGTQCLFVRHACRVPCFQASLGDC